MDQNQNIPKIRRTIFIIFLGLLILVGWIIFSSIRDQGTVKVSLGRTPFDNKVLLNDVEVNSSNIQLKPGNYTFKVSRDGFYPKDISIAVAADKTNSFNLVLSPQTEEAKKLIKEDERYHYDHSLSGGDVIDPVLDVLPIRNAIYTVDSQARKEVFPTTPITITITASDGYRNTAIRALADKKVNPSNYSYIFLNYKDSF